MQHKNITQTELHSSKKDYRYIKITTGGFSKLDREILFDFLKENFGKIYIKIGEEIKHDRKFWYYRQM
jgi:hypothetical protein